jgi:hypothetical protein
MQTLARGDIRNMATVGIIKSTKTNKCNERCGGIMQKKTKEKQSRRQGDLKYKQ